MWESDGGGREATRGVMGTAGGGGGRVGRDSQG